MSLRLHLRDAIEEFLQEDLNLARFPKVRSEALKVDLHIMNFIRDGKIPIEIQKSHHCAEGLL